MPVDDIAQEPSILHDDARLLRHLHTNVGQLGTARVAVEQPHAQLGLQLSNLFAQRGCGHVERPGRAPEVIVIGNG